MALTTEQAEQAEQLILRLIADHADSLLRVARRHSICADDAHDAYQRGLEILVRHAWRLDPERAAGWLHVVVRREAVALNRSRRRYLGHEEVDVDRFEASTSRSPEEAVEAFERVQRSAAALKQLKPQELRALWLKALGYSYEEICAHTDWTYTKVNRCLAEGRRSFFERFAGIETGAECRRLAPHVSAVVDGEIEVKPGVRAEVKAHLRHCRPCRTVVRELHGANGALAAVLPLGALAVPGVAEVSEPATHFAVRLYETAVLALNERAAHTVLRAQAVIEAVTTTKVAAAASAAVAMTGGGLAVERAVHAGEPVARPIARAAAAPGANALGASRPRAGTDPRRAGPRRANRVAKGPVVRHSQTVRPASTATIARHPQAAGSTQVTASSAPPTAPAGTEFSFE